MNHHKTSIAIIGYGKLGHSLARAFVSIGYRLVGVVEREHVDDKWLDQNKVPLFSSVEQIPADVDVVIITVPDSNIESVADEIVNRNGFRKGTIVAHTAGAVSTEPLEPLRNLGLIPLAWHPLQTFTGTETDDCFNGITFGISGDPEAFAIGERLAVNLGGKAVEIPDKLRPLYHLSAVFASNLMAGLIGMSLELIGEVGLDEKTALEALNPLLKASLDNVLTLGLPDTITGPVQRDDIETVRKHLDLLSLFPEAHAVYQVLSFELLKRVDNSCNRSELRKLLGDTKTSSDSN